MDTTTTERIPGTKAIAQRLDNAVLHFIEIATGLGVSEADARKALPFMLKLKVVKLDAISGRSNFAHGIYCDREVIQRAANAAPKRVTVHVTQADNDHYFGQKQPTWRDGFCKIERVMTPIADPRGVCEFGSYGTIKVGARELIVTEAGGGWDIEGWAAA